MPNAVEIEEAVEEFQKARYANQNTDVETKVKEQYRDYEAEARSTVKEFYRLNHASQSFDFVQQKKAQYLSLNRKTMSVWEAMEFLNNLVDDSDPGLILCAPGAELPPALADRRRVDVDLDARGGEIPPEAPDEAPDDEAFVPLEDPELPSAPPPFEPAHPEEVRGTTSRGIFDV